jgi:hypothetical protein
MKQTRHHPGTRKAKLTQFFLAVGVVGVLSSGGMYLLAMSPLLIRAFGPALSAG